MNPFFLVFKDGCKFFTTGKSFLKVKTSEILTRFIFQRNHFRENGSVKTGAFIPNKFGDTSVNRVCDLDEELIWGIGKFVESKRKQKLYGRADINVIHVLDNKLEVKPWPYPLLSHANITAYPAFDPQLQNAKQKAIAVDLAIKSSGKIYKTK
ncbi:MAG: hypothetical protein IID18_05095 [Nitrospinae bacterium]|nr:hypothetical protein [Nitrospinota bacterium]